VSVRQLNYNYRSPDAGQVEKAKEQCLGLLEEVRRNYESFKERPPRSAGPDHRGSFDDSRGGGGGGYHNRGDRNGSGSYGGNNQYDPSAQYGFQQQPAAYGAPAGGAMSPVAAAPGVAMPQGAAAIPQEMLQYFQYYAENPQADPYLSMGGYAHVITHYYTHGGFPTAGAPAGYAGSPQQQNGGFGAPPPPPPPPGGDEPPPPPPPPGSDGMASAGYNSVG